MDHMKKSTEAGLKSKSQEYEYIIEQYKKAHPARLAPFAPIRRFERSQVRLKPDPTNRDRTI